MFRIGGVVVVLIIGVAIVYQMVKPVPALKIFNPADVNPTLVDQSKQGVSRMHRVDDFKFIDQTGAIVSQKHFNGKIYVADFFFTTCGSICPKMSTQMQRVYSAFSENDEVMFLSHTVMPGVDSVPVLAKYARKYKANAAKWKFVTGAKKDIYELARKSYFAVTDQGTGDEHDFIHTENFVLIDTKKRIRGFYDGTSKEDVDRLIEEISILMAETDG